MFSISEISLNGFSGNSAARKWIYYNDGSDAEDGLQTSVWQHAQKNLSKAEAQHSTGFDTQSIFWTVQPCM